jgi:hypothetical protein
MNEEISNLYPELESGEKGSYISEAINYLLGEDMMMSSLRNDTYPKIIEISHKIINDSLARETIIYANVMFVKILVTIKSKKEITDEEKIRSESKMDIINEYGNGVDINGSDASSLQYFDELLKKYYLRTMNEIKL